MRVLHLQRQPCIRALKYGAGMRAARPDVRLGFACQGQTLSQWYGSGDELFERWWALPADDPRPALARALRDFRPDLVHSHNLPDALTVAALEVSDGRLPVIHDVHDLQSLRHTPYEDGFAENGHAADPDAALALEKAAVEGSAALVAVSDELLAEVSVRHRLPARTCVFANYALARDLPATLPQPRARSGAPRLVYQGTLSTNGGHYDLREIFAAIAAQGLSLDIYCGRRAPAYEALAGSWPTVRCHPPLSPARLMMALPAYDLGWAGLNATLNGAHLDTALPNKAFEYLGCGLAVITLPHRALSRLVSELGVGVTLQTLDGLAGQLAALDLGALRARIAAVRQRLTIRANIGRIAALYDSLAA